MLECPCRLGAGAARSVPRTGSDLSAELGDTAPCAVTPPIAYASALSPVGGSQSGPELPRAVSPINTKGFSYKEAIGVNSEPPYAELPRHVM